MLEVFKQPILTDVYARADEFSPLPRCGYVFAQSVEERSEHTSAWASTRPDIRFVEIIRQDATLVEVSIAGEIRSISLRSERQLREFWKWLGCQEVYLDITGLGHQVWAALLRSGLYAEGRLMVVYVEPYDYKFNAAPTEGQIFDLSEKISGIAPLPGFASLTDNRSQEIIFIPLLGFEGTRLSHVIEQVQPSNDSILPVIGVPGFRPEYPFHTYLGNRRPLVETKAWLRAEYVTANCPFGVYFLLQKLAAEHPRSTFLVAPIGTKPHAVGSVLFKVLGTHPIELVYDHPIRKPKRTRGSDHLLVYHVSAFLNGGS
jgi:hypothetical protein